MSIQERIAQLDPRERRLLMVLGGVFGVFVLLGIPLGLSAMLGSKRTANADMREAIEAIQTGRSKLSLREAEKQKVLARYKNPAPALAGFLDKTAKSLEIEIPESQDRTAVPQGKSYEERATKIVLSKIDLLKLSKFMEKIENAGYAVTINKLNIRKRGVEPDSYDVGMVVSSYHRTGPLPGEKKSSDENDEDE